jgi:hypothetical protein
MPQAARGGWCLAAILAAAWQAPALAEAPDAVPQQALQRAVAYLEQSQLPSGAFRMWACEDEALTACHVDNEPVVTGAILLALAAVTGDAPSPAIEPAAAFLRREMTAEGFFRYHRQENPLSVEQPPLLEDTAINQLALLAAGGDPPPSARNRLLTYQTIEGPFHLFALPLEDVRALRSDPAARERIAVRINPVFVQLLDRVEPVANANIQAYLATSGGASEPLCRYLMDVAGSGPEPGYSVFYPSPAAFHYAFSRAYARGAGCLEPGLVEMQKRLLKMQQKDGSWGGVVDTAWAGTALLLQGYTGKAVDRAAAYLLSQQREDGSWPRAVTWTLQRPPLWFGSEALSTGLALEFLGRYLQQQGARS